MDLNEYYYMHSNCFIVKGVKQSTICDLERNDFEILPLELSILLLKYNGEKLQSLLNDIKQEDYSTCLEYIDYLQKKEYIYTSQNPCGISYDDKINYFYSNKILNSIIDFNPIYFKKSIEMLHMLNCDSLQVRVFYHSSSIDLINQLYCLKDTSFNHIEIFFSNIIDQQDLIALDKANNLINNRIKRVYINDSIYMNIKAILFSYKLYGKIFAKDISSKDCGNCYSHNFSCNYDTFSLSQK